MNPSELYDLVITGGGPSGLTASVFAVNKNLKTLVVEGAEAGGQLTNLYPFKPVYNFPGYAHIQAGELAEKMIDQVKQKGVEVFEQAPVEK